MLGRNVVVLHAPGIALRGGEGIGCRLGEAHFHARALDLGPARQLVLQLVTQGLHAPGYARDNRGHHALILANQRQQKVGRLDALVVIVTGNLLSLENCLLGFLGKFIKLHEQSPNKKYLVK